MFTSLVSLAAGGGAISLLFLVIAIISWLWNVFNGNQNVPGAGRQPLPQRGGKNLENDLQAEINRFLRNVTGQKPDPNDDLEVLVVEDEDEDARPRPRQKSKAKSEAARRKSAAGQTKSLSSQSTENRKESRPGGRISERKVPGSTNLGSSVRQHVAEHMQEGRVLQQAQAHFSHGVAEKIEQDLGTFSGSGQTGHAALVTTSQQTATAISVARLIRDPVNLKEAFVLSLILDRPNPDRLT